ncbi:hypothetical protein [Priestia aryabhattai]|uniref:DUF4352 domain-containing protein n=1 Tax=Priestia aryabhattai TaxID=412384 RepID=A0ABD7WU30_PRIAR|nr:hypothetical protein [Priestia aryabhattai]WEA43815.1 hypothetical protein PWO00_23770 [Priestia aryabhattai]
MPTWVQWVSFALSIVGSISGIYALVLNHQRTTITKRKETERLEAKKKAKFSVDRTKEMGSTKMQHIFLLQNIGEAEARNVKVEFYNYDRDGNKQEINPLADSIPSRINSGQTVKTLLLLFVDMAPPFEIVVTWEDDFQNENKLETTLN